MVTGSDFPDAGFWHNWHVAIAPTECLGVTARRLSRCWRQRPAAARPRTRRARARSRRGGFCWPFVQLRSRYLRPAAIIAAQLVAALPLRTSGARSGSAIKLLPIALGAFRCRAVPVTPSARAPVRPPCRRGFGPATVVVELREAARRPHQFPVDVYHRTRRLGPANRRGRPLTSQAIGMLRPEIAATAT